MLSATTEALLTELCTLLCSRPWVRTFLLNADIRSDIALLSSPLSLRHAMSHVRHIHAEEPSDNHVQVLDHTTTDRALRIPAFSLNSITVGLCLHSRTVRKRWPFLEPPPHTLSFSRFALFHSEGVLLEARGAAGATETELILTELRSSRKKSVVSLSLRAAPDTLAAVHAPALVAHVTRSLMQICKTEYTRDCPFCPASAVTACRCEPRRVLERYLLDYAAFHGVMARFDGQYTGSASVEFFRNGVQTLHANLESRVEEEIWRAQGAAKNELVQRGMHNRLLQYRLAKAGDEGEGGGGVVEDAAREGRRRAVVVVEDETDAGGRNDPIGRLAAQLMAKHFDDVGGGTGAGMEEVEVEEKAGGDCKEQLNRREKNRMAAKRSNLKRKLRNKRLRLKLVIMRQRMTELKDRESELRCEHMWLKERCRVEGAGTEVSAGTTRVGGEMDRSQDSGVFSVDCGAVTRT